MTEAELKRMGYEKQEDGTYKKKESGSSKKKRDSPESGKVHEDLQLRGADELVGERKDSYPYRFYGQDEGEYTEIELRLFGTPMPKQSARFFAIMSKGKPTVRSYQPPEFKERVKDYQRQIKEQLPEGFEMFTKEVIIEEYTVVFPPLKGFSKKKMDFIREGGFVKKVTNPDLPDNLKKLPLDSMSGIVFKDDGLIWQECKTLKVHGTGGCIIIKLKGK